MTDQVNKPSCGVVRAIACRPTDSNPMVEIENGHVLPGRGFDTENRKAGRREITLISAQSWEDTCRDLGRSIPWHTRRANLLIDGLDLIKAIGETISIGPVRVKIHKECKPCGLMERQYAGLRTALAIDGRGGVTGEVLTEGIISVGDSVTCT